MVIHKQCKEQIHLRHNIFKGKIPFFSSFPFISVLKFVKKSMTVLLPNKSVSVHIFQKINEHVSMLFWQSRVGNDDVADADSTEKR